MKNHAHYLIVSLGLLLMLFHPKKVLAYDFEVDGFCYNILSSNQVEVTSYSNNIYYSGHVVIPEKVKYEEKEYAVISIGNFAFANSHWLNSLTISNSVTSIGQSAFIHCNGLTSITISNSVTSIGEAAFMGCTALASIKIPNSVISIGSSAFDYCTGLTSITIPNSVTAIGNSVFSGCI